MLLGSLKADTDLRFKEAAIAVESGLPSLAALNPLQKGELHSPGVAKLK